MALSVGATLGRYKIISPISAGGMGEVYRAEDTLLSRQVAIKTLPPHLAENTDALKRFQKEAKALAALSHSNILTIYDLILERGASFVVMELLEGETLRARIAKSQLSWQEAIEIAVGIAEGIAAAHSKGVIHRDLKPENILITSQGIVKILDFGLARFQQIVNEEELTESPTISKTTESGIVRGTVPYMSPEQVRGEHPVARSDIFSFGCILYEMLAGRRPFSGTTPAETAAAILRDDPPKLTGIPTELERIVQHCLEKNPERRLHSAHDLAFALKDLLVSSSSKVETAPFVPPHHRKASITAGVVGLTALLLILGAIGLRQKIIRGPTEKIESLAVLPLKNLSGDPKQEYFADGMTEELIAKLARISALRVISRTSVMEYKGSHKKSLPQIAKELNVDAIVEGSVLQSGDRVRITAQLIHAPSDKNLWAESYERKMTDILSLQNEVATTVAQAIRVKLTPQEQAQFAAATQVNPAAYEAYLRGINYIDRVDPTLEETRLAITMFERAIEIDPDFALAYARLSTCYSWKYHMFYDRTGQTLNKAKQAVDRAFQIQPELPEAHIAMGYYLYRGFRNYEQALQEFSIAQNTMPNDPDIFAGFGATYRRQGKLQASLRTFKKELELDPKNAAATVTIGTVYDMLGDYAEAMRYSDLAISLAPDNSAVYWDKALSYLKFTGYPKGARAIIMKIPALNQRNSFLAIVEMLDRNYQLAVDLRRLAPSESSYENASYENAVFYGACYRLMKKPEMARRSYDSARVELEKLTQVSPEAYFFHSLLGLAYAGLNRKEQAIREAKKAVELLPVSKDAFSGPVYVRNLAIVYTMVGEYERALDQIEYLLSIPTYGPNGVSVPMLRIDPTWDPLRSHPRFQKILEKYGQSQSR